MVRSPEISRSPAGTVVTLDGERIWIWLSTRHLMPDPVSYTDSPVSFIAESILSVSGASADFTIDVVEDVDLDFFSIPLYTTALKAIRNLVEKSGRLMRFSEDSAEGKNIVIDAMSYTAPGRHSLRFGANTTNIERDLDLAERVTRVYAAGGGDPPLTLQNSSLSSQAYIDAPSYSTENHFVGVYKNLDLLDWENLVPIEKNPDFSGTYANGLADGWFLIGTPTCTKNVNAQYLEYGDASQKIVTQGAAPQGIECPITGVANTHVCDGRTCISNPWIPIP